MRLRKDGNCYFMFKFVYYWLRGWCGKFYYIICSVEKISVNRRFLSRIKLVKGDLVYFEEKIINFLFLKFILVCI